MKRPGVLGTVGPEDHDAVARLLHRSLVAWYESKLRQGHRFGSQSDPYRLIPQVYAALDPGEAVASRDEATGELLGVCFVHPRPTHVSVGIVATSPEAQGRGVARAMLEPVLAKAHARGVPVRLVSSLLNLDSFSLYSRLGFVPHTLYQDVVVPVPAAGLPVPPPVGASRIRLARSDEAPRIAELERRLQGIDRERDYAFFLKNPVGDWRVWVEESSRGDLLGVMVASLHPHHGMIGPGVAVDEATATALLWNALDALRGGSPVILAPCSAGELVRTLYSWGGRNLELHAAQACGRIAPATGLAFPTFLPESA